MEKRNKNTSPENDLILPGNDDGLLTGSSPQQGIPVRGLEEELPEDEPEDTQKRKPVKAEEKEKLKKS